MAEVLFPPSACLNVTPLSVGATEGVDRDVVSQELMAIASVSVTEEARMIGLTQFVSNRLVVSQST
jgi:hypothetical protein